jgi:8-oxo-dGTP pyrophosphatase MutT (NUDIX family)
LRICAGAVLTRGRDILLAKRADDRRFYPGVWDIIGGHCEANEAPADTLVRELREEIGITPRTIEEIAVLGEPKPSEHGQARYHIFVVSAWDGGEPRLLGTEHSDLRWMTVADALTLPLAHPGYRELFATLFPAPSERPLER